MTIPPNPPPTSPQEPFLALKSERVQEALARLTAWQPSLGGLEGTFRFDTGSEALAFLRPLGALLDRHREPPSRLTLTGPILSIGLGLGSESGGVYGADLALAERITALRNVVGGKPKNPPARLGR